GRSSKKPFGAGRSRFVPGSGAGRSARPSDGAGRSPSGSRSSTGAATGAATGGGTGGGAAAGRWTGTGCDLRALGATRSASAAARDSGVPVGGVFGFGGSTGLLALGAGRSS